MAKTTKSQARTKRERSEFLWGWLFILPTTIGLIVLNIIPIFQTIYQSFFKTGDFGKGNIFIGLQNYQKVFADKEIWQALINTFKYAIVEVPFSIVIALVLAVLLNRKMKGRNFFFGNFPGTSEAECQYGIQKSPPGISELEGDPGLWYLFWSVAPEYLVLHQSGYEIRTGD